ncbi:hypothetical protein [Streptomyces blastmyceticus]|uniref:hypothetical protein n=1 Tax=Streptomyces blastmyceticus TaxID=68180 RepID=UPI0031D87FE2
MAVFASPATRILLASDGLTTTLLQAAVGWPLAAQVHRIEAVDGRGVSAAARFLLCAGERDRFLVRQTTLVLPSGEPVSENTVVLRLGVDPRIDAVAADGSRPIGFALAEADLIHERRIVSAGAAHWPLAPGTPRCVSKTYVLTARTPTVPVLCIQELFNPSFISAAPTPARQSADSGGRRTPLVLLPEGAPCSARPS